MSGRLERPPPPVPRLCGRYALCPEADSLYVTGLSEVALAAGLVLAHTAGLQTAGRCTFWDGLFVVGDGYWGAAALVVAGCVGVARAVRPYPHPYLVRSQAVTSLLTAFITLGAMVTAITGIRYLTDNGCRYIEYQLMLAIRMMMVTMYCFAVFAAMWAFALSRLDWTRLTGKTVS